MKKLSQIEVIRVCIEIKPGYTVYINLDENGGEVDYAYHEEYKNVYSWANEPQDFYDILDEADGQEDDWIEFAFDTV